MPSLGMVLLLLLLLQTKGNNFSRYYSCSDESHTKIFRSRRHTIAQAAFSHWRKIVDKPLDGKSGVLVKDPYLWAKLGFEGHWKLISKIGFWHHGSTYSVCTMRSGWFKNGNSHGGVRRTDRSRICKLSLFRDWMWHTRQGWRCKHGRQVSTMR